RALARRAQADPELPLEPLSWDVRAACPRPWTFHSFTRCRAWLAAAWGGVVAENGRGAGVVALRQENTELAQDLAIERSRELRRLLRGVVWVARAVLGPGRVGHGNSCE